MDIDIERAKIAKPIRLKPSVLVEIEKVMEKKDLSFQKLIEKIINDHFVKTSEMTQKKLALQEQTDAAPKLFLYWCEIFKKGDRVSFTKKDRTLVNARLLEFNERQLKQAIFGCWYIRSLDKSPYHDFALIMRNGEKVRNFAQHCLTFNNSSNTTKKIDVSWLTDNEYNY